MVFLMGILHFPVYTFVPMHLVFKHETPLCERRPAATIEAESLSHRRKYQTGGCIFMEKCKLLLRFFERCLL